MLIGLFITLAFLLLLLLIPVTLIVHMSAPSDIRGDIEVCWLFGLVKMPVFFSQFRKTPDRHGKQHQIHRRLRKADNWRKRFSNPTNFHRLLRFAQAFWMAIHHEDLRLKLRIGLGDPADTGKLWGFIGPLSAIFNSQAAVICVEPEFFDTTLDIKGSGKIWFYPLRLVFLVIGLVFSMQVWRAKPLGVKISTS